MARLFTCVGGARGLSWLGVATALFVLTSCTSGSDGEIAEHISVPRVTSFTAFSGGGAWSVTDEGVLRTPDGGQRWVDVTPRGLQLREGLFGGDTPPPFFVSGSSRAWVVTFSSPQAGTALAGPSATIFRTTDGGDTWDSSILALDPEAGQYADTGAIFFHDETAGWLEGDIVTGSAFSQSVLYRTSDGGGSWSKSSIPVGGTIHFSSPSDGWVAGGPARSELHMTRDGGETWTEQSVPQASPEKPWLTTVAAPVFFDSQNGVLPVQVRSEGEDGSALNFYRSLDGGESWSRAGPPIESEQGGDIFFGDAPKLSIVDESNWFVVTDELYVTQDGGSSWSTVSTNQDFREAVKIDFTTAEDGWLVLESTECEEKGNCVSESLVLATRDAGHTWTEVDVRAEPE